MTPFPTISQIEGSKIFARIVSVSLSAAFGQPYGESLAGDLFAPACQNRQLARGDQGFERNPWKAIYRDWLDSVRKRLYGRRRRAFCD